MLARAAMASVLPPARPFSANSANAISRISRLVRSRSRRRAGGGFEQARERRNIDARCELNELDLVQAHPLAGERPFELTVRVRSHPRRIGRSAGSHGDHAQADEAEAGTRGLGRKRDRRKVQCRQMSKAEIRHG